MKRWAWTKWRGSGEPAEVRREAAHYFALRERMSVRTSWLGYGLQALLLVGVVPAVALALWAGGVLLCEALNGYLARRLQRNLDDEAGRRRALCALAFTLFLASSCWGAVTSLPGVAGNEHALLLQLLILAATAIFCVHNLCLHWAGMTAFSAGLLWPSLLRASLHGGGWQLELGLAGFALLCMVQIYGYTTRKLLLQGIRSRLASERLAEELARRNEELKQAMQLIRQLAMQDPLTHCLNRRAFMEQLEHDERRARTGGIGIAMMDVDHFKHINDSHGHGVGDAVLVALAERLRGELREGDILARWGGEEFLCLLQGVDAEGLRAKAEAMRVAVAATPLLAPPHDFPVTISVGIAHGQRLWPVDEAIEHADRALYRAKGAGRNRVCA